MISCLFSNATDIRKNGRTVFCVSLLALLLLCSPFIALETHAQEGETVHTVASGEYLSTIARKYNVSVTAILDRNNITNANLIRPGQKIAIPSTVRPLPTTKVPLATPAAGNSPPAPQSSPDATRPGVTPPPTSPPPGGTTEHRGIRDPIFRDPIYRVRRGDNLTGIAAIFGVTVQAIVNRNRLPSSVIFVSQKLIIPVSGVVPALTSTHRPPRGHTATPTRRNTATPTARPTNTPAPIKPWFWPFSRATATPTPGGGLR